MSTARELIARIYTEFVRVISEFEVEVYQERMPSSYHSNWSGGQVQAFQNSLVNFLLFFVLVAHVTAAILATSSLRGIQLQAQSAWSQQGNISNMPPKKTRGKDSLLNSGTMATDIRPHFLQDKQSRMALRSETETVVSTNDLESVESTVLLEQDNDDNTQNDPESEDNYLDCNADEPQIDGQISNNELAKMMTSLTSQFTEVRVDIKTMNEKFTVNSEKIDKLNDSMTEIFQKVETVSIENKGISDEVKSNRSDIVEVIRQQNEYNTKCDEIIREQNEFNTRYDQIVTLANSLKEKDLLIEHMKLRIENLEDENRKAKDKDEAREQHGRKMNLWVYGVEEPEKENTRQTVRNFCINVLKLDGKTVDNWLIKNTHRVGQYKTPKRPIIVAFVLWEDRQALLKSAKHLYQYNTDNDTTFAVKTDLAPRARQMRKDLHYVSKKMKEAEKCQAKVRDNAKGVVWLERKQNKDDRTWVTVPFAEIKNEYLPPHLKRPATTPAPDTIPAPTV